MNSIEENKRMDILDYLRGFALMGIILVNILPLLAVKLPEMSSINEAYQKFLILFVEGRFYTLFSFLFGVGFYLFISRALGKGKNGYVLFLRRIIALFIFGLIHVRFHPGEALTVYAVTGLLLLPFYKVKKEINLVIGVILLILFSLMAFKLFMVIPLILLGIAAGQYHVFERITEKTKSVAIFTAIMLVFSIVGVIFQYSNSPSGPFEFWGSIDEQTYRFLSIGIMIGPLLTSFYAGGLILLLRFPLFQRLLSPLKSYGRMALTNYIFQTVSIYTAGYSFNLFENISYIQSLVVCLIIYILQLFFSVFWMKFFLFGPLEWVWRSITYLHFPPLKRHVNSSST